MIHSPMVFKHRLCLILVVLLTLAANFRPFPDTARAGQASPFTGSWIANGSRQIFPFGKDRNVYTFKLAGHVNLKEAIGGELDFWSEIIGLSDSKTGTEARCVWRDLDGRELFLVLRSDLMQSDVLVTGKIVGGTGKFAGATGELSFKWSSISFYRDNLSATISGQALDLKGKIQLPNF